MKKILACLIFLILPIISFADEIFIPVELWLGENISQSEKIVLPEVSFKFGYKERYKIKGPIIWQNSKTMRASRYIFVPVIVRKKIKRFLNSGQLQIIINVQEEFLMIGVIDLQKMDVSCQLDFGRKARVGHLRQITLMKKEEIIQELKLLLS